MQNIHLALIFNDYGEMKQNLDKLMQVQADFQPWYFVRSEAPQVCVCGLASFRIFRETRDPLWAKKAHDYHEKILSYSEQCSSWNFEHWCYLFRAEEAYSHGNFERAQGLYDSALFCARRSKFIADEALICDLAANFYLNMGNKISSLKYYSIAHGKYLEWGALEKAQQLNAFVLNTFGTRLSMESRNFSLEGSTDSRKRDAAL